MPDHDSPTDKILDDAPRRRIASISFDPVEAQWIDSVVASLKTLGYRHISRSEIVNVAVRALRDQICDRTPYDLLRFFLDRSLRTNTPPEKST